jgi:hypothetical protein
MVKSAMDDYVALVKMVISYSINGEEQNLITTLTPFEYSSAIPFEDQYDFVDLAILATGIKWYELKDYELEEFRDSLEVKVHRNPDFDICLN